MKTNELTGAALDWAVARCVYGAEKNIPAGFPAFSESWAHGGPLIEGAGIGVWMYSWNPFGEPEQEWYAEDEEGNHVRRGDTPLIAAMRCYVASKLGDVIELPKELQ